MLSKLALFTLLLPSALATTSEVIAMGGAGNGANLDWASLTYDESSVVSASNVTLTAAPKASNKFSSVSLDGALQLTARIAGDKMYAYMSGDAPAESGCCAGILRAFETDGSYSDTDLVELVSDLFSEVTDWAYATHTFDIVDGVAYMMIQYEEPSLNNAKADAIVALDLETGEVVKTADGDSYFSFFEKLATDSTAAVDTIFSIQHYATSRRRLQGPPGPSGSTEEWHGNGILPFTSVDGTRLFAITHRTMNECVVMSDPWQTVGGGRILQRFGNPGIYSSSGSSTSSHVFGMEDVSSGNWNGMHNAYYAVSPTDGRESITVFVNSNGGSSSALYEFDLKLVSEDSVLAGDLDDSVFDTAYRTLELPFSTGSQGGARPIGPMVDGKNVYVVAGGGSNTGITVVSQDGESMNYNPSSSSVYDPFVYYTL
ncbi:hypothetical protein TeGR_g11473 [Tetraparma gracilis]|uniref:Uncharacterized protein n=1 Tax=Tetraparma gracilis TaxID=2962635 RepID=A0ABQ6N4F1_9STRA|nr:hypothetical protein TeGR_g11473 [Tetraparma gracilis]